MKKALFTLLIVVLAANFLLAADAKEDVYSAAHKQAIAAVEKQGGLVLPISANAKNHRVDYHLQGKDLTDAGLANLKNVPGLIDLNVAGTKVTDAGLKQIGAITTLERLNLNNTKVTDAGLANLKGLKNLVYLNLYGAEGVTDKGLDHLKGLTKLKALYLWKTKATKDGVKKLETSLKGIRINTGWDLTPIVVVPIAAKPVLMTVNLKCPIKGTPVSASKTFTYKGKLIGFCCANCLAAFKKSPEKYIAKVKEDNQAAKPKKLTISTVMKAAMKGPLLKKVLEGKASKAEQAKLVEYFTFVSKQKVPKGNAASWKTLTTKLLDSAKKVAGGDKKAVAALKAASNCKACHSKHKK
jgi:YHS domain-containing protein